METNAFLNSVFPNLSFHAPRHYFWVTFFICKPYGNKCFPEFFISEWFLPSIFVNTFLLICSYANHMKTNAFLNLCVPECVLPFTSPILVYSLLHAETYWKPMISWIRYFRSFLSIHFINTVLLTLAVGNHIENIWFHEFVISESFFPFTSSMVVLLTCSIENHMEPMIPWTIYFRMCHSIYVVNTLRCINICMLKPNGNQWLHESCISESFLQFTSPILLHEPLQSETIRKHATEFMHSWFPNLPFDSLRQYLLFTT